MSTRDDVLATLESLGFSEVDSGVLADHFLDAEARGRRGHGLTRVEWLTTLPDLDPDARPERIFAEPGFERWDGRGALGLPDAGRDLPRAARGSARQRPRDRRVALLPDRDARALGAQARRRRPGRGADGDVACAAPHPEGGDAAGRDESARDRDPELGRDGRSSPTSRWARSPTATSSRERRPRTTRSLGGEQAHKAFALAIGLQLLVDALAGDGYGAVLLVARPEADPVPGATRRAGGVHLPGDR